jgi:hypothetical protein
MTTMHPYFLSVVLVLLTSTAFAQPGADQAPQAARTHFAKQYPDAVVKEWERTSKHHKVDFKVKGVEYDTYYTMDGTWVRTEHDIPKSALPAAITDAVKSGKHGSWKVDDVEEHATPEHPVLYKVQVENDVEKVELFFTPDGKLFREQKKTK